MAWNAVSGETTVSNGRKGYKIRGGGRRVEIDHTHQALRAYQGDLLVVKTLVNTGRTGKRAPASHFSAGLYKAQMHYSRLYDNAPMPWSVQVEGNVFLHGFQSVPEHPASHGCVRMPVDNGNLARYFYPWVSVGTPITITGRWSG